MRRVVLAVAALALVPPALAHAAAAPGGEAVFQDRCGFCHSFDANGQGPDLKGVVGRKAGAAADFPYTAPMKASGLVWTPETLDRFLAAPAKVVPGTAMQVNVPDAGERKALIAYLAAHSNLPGPTK